jgi:TolB-like protein/Tfp pilus assembly protein PilF
LSPEAAAGTAPVPRSDNAGAPIDRASGRRWIRRMLPAAALVVIGLSAWLLFRPVSTAPASASLTPSIAVLPFLDMSGDRSNLYFSDGITEEVLNVLAQVPGLRVAARTSSFAFRDKDVAVDSIGRALNVSHVLEGSVRSQGSRVRITAQLIEAANGFHVWSETYDRDLDDIFVVQDEIAAAIAKKLQIELAGDFWGLSARETSDPEAYRLLLRALHVFRTPSAESYATSANLLAEALQRDPGYARAYGALANVLLWQASFGWTDARPAYARADSLARRGLEIGETPESHVALARLAEVLAWNPDSADSHFMRALEINPSDARTLQYRALFLARSNRGDEAVAAGRRATELDPLHPGSWSNYAAVLSMLSREDEALAAMEKARTIAPNDVLVLTNLANQYSNVGRIDDALATSGRALAIDSLNLNLLGLRVHLLFGAGRTDEAMQRLQALEKRPEFPRFRLATLYGHTQDIERILDLLEEASARKEGELSRIRSPDMFRGMRHHPRFVKLLDALGSGGS